MPDFNCFAWGRYLFHIITGARPKALMNSIDLARAHCGQSRPVLLADMLWCLTRYGAGYHDYVMFKFYNMDAWHRKTYVTRLRNKRLVTLVNDSQAAYDFDHKASFYPRFREYLGRDFLVVENASAQDLARLMQGNTQLFAKPDVGESGKGIEAVELRNFTSPEILLDYLKAHGMGVVEEPLAQHQDLARLHPQSINTLRIVTLLTGGPGSWKPNCVYAVIKTGCGGRRVDNLESGGLFCPIDQKAGTICGPGHTSDLRVLDHHPDTGIPLVGYQIPFVKEAVDLCLKAALVEPRMRYIGWDVCITPNGPVIVEGNDYPGYDFWQQPEHTPDQVGLWPYYKKLIPEL